jgi:hypothetical protein
MREKHHITVTSYGMPVQLEVWAGITSAENASDTSPGRNASTDWTVFRDGRRICHLLTEAESDAIDAEVSKILDDQIECAKEAQAEARHDARMEARRDRL